MKTFFLETRTSTFGIFNNARNTCGSLKFKYVDVKIFPEIPRKARSASCVFIAFKPLGVINATAIKSLTAFQIFTQCIQ